MTGAQLVLCGDLAATGLLDWICHRARLLDLTGSVQRETAQRIVINVSGPADLIDAMEVACLLGPVNVMVERIERTRITPDASANGFKQC
ncbi:MAG: acylphosphatase [Sedimentitalea sp.]